MASKVYISWSGKLSRMLAEEIRQWLPSVLQFVKPYFTPEDIEKGSIWFTDITNELESSKLGIICLTKENVNKPWILFEVGALSNRLEKGNVCTIIFDMETTDLTPPLSNFQTTAFKREDFKKLIKHINKIEQENKLEDKVLDDVFDMWWPKLEEKIKNILAKQPEIEEERETRSERDILEEVLELTRRSKIYNRKNNMNIRHALSRLLETLHEYYYMQSKEDNPMAMMLFERLRRPLRELCREADMPELYDRFMHDFMKFRHMNDIEDEA